MKCCSAGGRAVVVSRQMLRDSRVLFPALPLMICVVSKASAHLKRTGGYSLLPVSGSCEVLWLSATAGVRSRVTALSFCASGQSDR